jgi:hypothetical protein
MTGFLNAQFRDEGGKVKKYTEQIKKESGTEITEKKGKEKCDGAMKQISSTKKRGDMRKGDKEWRK